MRFGSERRAPPTYPLLPIRDVVVFPHAPVSLIIARAHSKRAVEAAWGSSSRELFLLTQRDADQLEPTVADLHTVGTVSALFELFHLPDGSMKILVEGRRRASLRELLQEEPYRIARVEEHLPRQHADPELMALARTVKSTFERYAKLNRAVPPEMLLSVNALDDPDRLADMLIPALSFKTRERQELLAILDPERRLDQVYRALLAEIEFLQVEKKYRARAKREHRPPNLWLNEQIKVLHKDLGDKEGRSEIEELAEALAAKELPAEARTRAEKELRKLAQMNLMSAEATVVRNYLDWIVQIPWTEAATEPVSLERAARVLDEDHFGLRKIKERILEYLAVSTLVETMRGPILCLVGPPGVGKTSLARSVARAMGRPFVKISLGGLRDEAEIRGHRRTYIGAMPGKLIQALKRAGQVDPVILLDEIDKMSSDFRGDPASALLEVLDPEQNRQFNDHYLELDYDLSKVTFICTANALQGIPLPLQDRLEIIQLSGYTELEKAAIVRRYLLPRQMELNGLQPHQLRLSDPALLKMIRHYTRESGVRKLEQQVAKICRKVARRVVHHGPETRIQVTTTNLDKLLGVPRYSIGERDRDDQVGAVKGLAVGPYGGELLNIEVAAVRGKGKLLLTGRLGDWLKESATAALTYLRTRVDALDLDEDFHESRDLHIHYPGNALQTDGPSAGIAMATALVSALTQIPARADTAMTGEISLRGRVLPVGGLKEKVLAAHRGGITRVLIPEENLKDLDEIPERIRRAMTLIPVRHMDQVLQEALTGGPHRDGVHENSGTNASHAHLDQEIPPDA